MSITLKKLKSVSIPGQGTLAYDTDVLFDGKHIGRCSNRGDGGMGCFWAEKGVDQKIIDKATEWAKAQVFTDTDGTPILNHGKTMSFDYIDDYCDFLVEDTQNKKAEVSWTKRNLKNKTFFKKASTDPNQPLEDGLFVLSKPFSADLKNQIVKKYPGAVILNELPLEEAVTHVRNHDARLRKNQREAWEKKAETPAETTEPSSPIKKRRGPGA